MLRVRRSKYYLPSSWALVRRCEINTGMSEIKITTVATTFTTLALFGRDISLRIHSGSVSTPGGAVKIVTTTSSKLRANASSAPATNAVLNCGNVTNLNVCHRPAPRSADASCSEGFMRLRRANTLLKTMTIQNVAWATIMPK